MTKESCSRARSIAILAGTLDWDRPSHPSSSAHKSVAEVVMVPRHSIVDQEVYGVPLPDRERRQTRWVQQRILHYSVIELHETVFSTSDS